MAHSWSRCQASGWWPEQCTEPEQRPVHLGAQKRPWTRSRSLLSSSLPPTERGSELNALETLSSHGQCSVMLRAVGWRWE